MLAGQATQALPDPSLFPAASVSVTAEAKDAHAQSLVDEENVAPAPPSQAVQAVPSRHAAWLLAAQLVQAVVVIEEEPDAGEAWPIEQAQGA